MVRSEFGITLHGKAALRYVDFQQASDIRLHITKACLAKCLSVWLGSRKQAKVKGHFR